MRHIWNNCGNRAHRQGQFNCHDRSMAFRFAARPWTKPSVKSRLFSFCQGCFLLISLALALPGSGFADETPIETGINSISPAEFQTKLTQLIEVRLKEDDEAGAAYLRQWHVPILSDRQLLLLPITPRPLGSASNSSKGAEPIPWHDEFERFRKSFAHRIWEESMRSSDAGRLDNAYASICNTLFYDPNHKLALSVFGSEGRAAAKMIGESNGTSTIEKDSSGRPPGRKARVPHPNLGWPAGSYWQWKTPNFLILTQIPPAELDVVAVALERLLLVWRQTFAPYWMSPKDLERISAGKRVPGNTERFEVVVFSTRENYQRHLERFEPQVGITLGMYRARDRRSYFFGDPKISLETLQHEITHQLFQESAAARIGAGEKTNFWLIEGLALYMESIRNHPRYSTLGGWDAPRLQHARYRSLMAGKHLPFRTLAGMGREALQQDEDIRGIYSQAAGLMHFMMDSHAGRYRPLLFRQIADVYGMRMEQEGEGNTEISIDRIDEIYQTEFLPVRDTDLRAIQGDEAPVKLCLGGSLFEGHQLRNLERCNLSRLQWLDLTRCRFQAADLEFLKKAQALEQLSLEGTPTNDLALTFLNSPDRLRELDLSHTEITDEGIRGIRDYKNLEVLWLSGTKISDDSLLLLTALPKLRVLGLGGTRVTAGGREGFSHARPDVRQED